MASPVALLTDFGVDDWYVGLMKSVILTINSSATLIDITHSVPPHDLEAANFALIASYKYLPSGSIVVVVVDPGVGGKRSILCAESGGRHFVFPDNGVLTEFLDREGFEKLVRVENPELFLRPVSSTFHGRDIFAPVAAHLSLGVEAERLGPDAGEYVRLAIAGPGLGEDHATTRVRWIDRFGNLVTDCPAGLVEDLSGKWGGIAIDLGPCGATSLADTYGGVERGRPLGILGSSGYLEVSIREASAARALDLTLGDTVILRKP